MSSVKKIFVTSFGIAIYSITATGCRQETKKQVKSASEKLQSSNINEQKEGLEEANKIYGGGK